MRSRLVLTIAFLLGTVAVCDAASAGLFRRRARCPDPAVVALQQAAAAADHARAEAETAAAKADAARAEAEKVKAAVDTALASVKSEAAKALDSVRG